MARVTTEISAKSNMRAGIAQAKSDMKAFRSAVAAEQKAIEQQNKKGASGRGGMAGNLGNVSNQVSDIAVQLQGGAKAATVIAQQGSQIAASFGPYGAIAGGVLAIGAGIYSWATNAHETEEALKNIARNAEQSAKAIESVKVGTKEDRKTVRMNTGETDAIQEKFEARMEEIAAAEKLVQFSDAAGNAAIAEARAAAEAAYQSERAAEAAKEKAEVYKEVDANTQKALESRKELEEVGQTFLEKQIALARQIGELAANSGKGDSLAQSKNELAISEKKLELAKMTATENERLNDEEKQAAEKRAADIKSGFEELARQMEELDRERERAAKKEERRLEKIAEKNEKIAEIKEKANQEKVEKKVALEMMTPQERSKALSDERKEERRKARAARVVVQKEKNRLLNEINNGKMTKEEANAQFKDFNRRVKEVVNPNAEMEKSLKAIETDIAKLTQKVDIAG